VVWDFVAVYRRGANWNAEQTAKMFSGSPVVRHLDELDRVLRAAISLN
jgi:hypothetical protein